MTGTYELKDKTGGFYDPITGFQIVRDQQAQVAEPIGEATSAVIRAGGLVKVEDAKVKKGKDAK